MTHQKRNKQKFILWAILSGLVLTVIACAPKIPDESEMEMQTARKPAKPRIGIVQFDNIHPMAEMRGLEGRIAVLLEQKLQETKRFVVVERSEVDKIIREQQLNLSRITESPQKDKKITPITGLDYLVTGTISGAQIGTEVTAKFIKLTPPNLGEIKATAKTISFTGQDASRMVNDLVEGILAAFPIEGQIAEVTADEVYLNIGSDAGVSVGQIFNVYSVSKVLIDPESQKPLYVEKQIGTLMIDAVQPRLSIASREAYLPAMEIGMLVRSQEKTIEPPTIPTKNVISIETFENRSGDVSLDWYGDTICGSLTTTLSNVQGFKMVEREHLDKLVDELKLQELPYFDYLTQVKRGKLWNPRYVIVGSYTKLGEFWRIDARRIDVQTSEVFEAEGLLGKDWNELVDRVGKKLLVSVEARKEQFQKSNIEKIQISSKQMTEVPTSIYHLLGTSKFLSNYSLVEYVLKNTSEEQSYRVMVSTQIQGYSHMQTDTIELAPGKYLPLYHTPAFRPERLAALDTTQTTRLELQVFLLEGSNQKSIWKRTPTVTLLPYDTIVWYLEGASGESKDLLPAIAAWVTAESAIAGEILGEAAKYSPHGSILGGQGTPEQIHNEVKAIYQALQKRGIRYVTQATRYPMEKGQRILLPSKSLDNESANCIDGTVLFASVLLRAGIDPLIIIVPGHAFLGWKVDKDQDRYEALETTVLGMKDFDTALKVGWKEVQKNGIAEKMESGLTIDSSGEIMEGSAIILDVRTLKEEEQIRDIPVSNIF